MIGCNGKANVEAFGLMKKITDTAFIACFQTLLHYLGYLRGMKPIIVATRNDKNEFDKVHEKILEIAEHAGMDYLDVPRICHFVSQNKLNFFVCWRFVTTKIRNCLFKPSTSFGEYCKKIPKSFKLSSTKWTTFT